MSFSRNPAIQRYEPFSSPLIVAKVCLVAIATMAECRHFGTTRCVAIPVRAVRAFSASAAATVAAVAAAINVLLSAPLSSLLDVGAHGGQCDAMFAFRALRTWHMEV